MRGAASGASARKQQETKERASPLSGYRPSIRLDSTSRKQSPKQRESAVRWEIVKKSGHQFCKLSWRHCATFVHSASVGNSGVSVDVNGAVS
jgi:hypothetical protein